VCRVAVVGAGYAGLAAADALRRAGLDVVVLEALDRVGGRVWSERLPNGAVVERGGEFVTEGYTAMERIAVACGLELSGMGIRYPDRRLVPDPGLDREAVVAAAAAVEEHALRAPDAPAAAILAEAVADEAIRTLLGHRVQSARAYALDGLDGAFLTDVRHLVADAETRRIEGGNQLLAERLAGRLAVPVRLRTAARRIEHGPGKVAVLTDAGRVEADACVVAVPAPAVARIAFDPPLPAPLAEAAAAVRMSTAAKLHACLTDPAGPDAPMSARLPFWAWATPCDGVGGRSVGAWAGAASVVEELDVVRGPARWLDAIAGLWPQLRIDATTAIVTTWTAAAWPGGAYSVIGRGDPAERGLAEGPAGRIAFAGEHTARDWTGTMEGALRSGERAAADVLTMA
jgi:monoamine oxidase